VDVNDEAFLRAICASPEDDAPRLIYADWLEERGDPRAELLRQDWGLPRITFLDWSWVQEHLEFYLRRHPELRSQLNEHDANRRWRDRVAALGVAVDPSWLALIETLGRPFRPFFFWNNTGPRSFQEGELPFREQIVARGAVLTFQSSFRGENAWQEGLAEDLAFLCRLPLGECEYGAASCPVHPFLCELEPVQRPLTGADVLRALKVADFRSQHIRALDAPAIPYPGYHPGTDNDEIHNDPAGQCLFPRPEEGTEATVGDEGDGPAAARQAVHDALRTAVVGGQLWYVLLHSRVGLPADGLDRGPWVVLFAVGRSRRGDRLLGVISHQVCHNLCD
jgi:uncharacterized protein (TIGR02996 family)